MAVPSLLEVQAMAKNREFVRFVKWVVVGGLGAVVDFSTLNLLVLWSGLEPSVANTFSFSAAVCSNFVLNRYWTYPESRNMPITKTAIQFLLISLVGLVINQIIFYLVLPVVSGFVPAPLDFNATKAFAIVVVLFWNYGANRFWTYRDVDKKV